MAKPWNLSWRALFFGLMIAAGIVVLARIAYDIGYEGGEQRALEENSVAVDKAD